VHKLLPGREAQVLHGQKEKHMKKAFWLIMTGVAIGILIAPASGSETWKNIRDRLGDLKDDAKDSVDDLVAGTKDMFKKSKETVKNVSNNW